MKKPVSIYSDLLNSLKTTREVSLFASDIETLTQNLFKSEKMSLVKALGSISIKNAEIIIQASLKKNVKTNDKDSISDFLETLKDIINQLKVIKLVLAFFPTYKTIEKIHNFVRDTIGIGYILDIETNESILAGAVVMFNGKYKDFTLSKSLDDVFSNKRGEILKPIQ